MSPPAVRKDGRRTRCGRSRRPIVQLSGRAGDRPNDGNLARFSAVVGNDADNSAGGRDDVRETVPPQRAGTHRGGRAGDLADLVAEELDIDAVNPLQPPQRFDELGSITMFAGVGRVGQAATAGKPTIGLSLEGAIGLSVM